MKIIHPLHEVRVENVLVSLWEDQTGLGQPAVVTIAYETDISPQLEFEVNHIYFVITALLGMALWAHAFLPTRQPQSDF